MRAKRRSLDAQSSVVVRAAEIVAALRTHQLAMMPGQPVRTRRAHLAMMLHRQLHRRVESSTAL